MLSRDNFEETFVLIGVGIGIGAGLVGATLVAAERPRPTIGRTMGLVAIAAAFLGMADRSPFDLQLGLIIAATSSWMAGADLLIRLVVDSLRASPKIGSRGRRRMILGAAVSLGLGLTALVGIGALAEPWLIPILASIGVPTFAVAAFVDLVVRAVAALRPTARGELPVAGGVPFTVFLALCRRKTTARRRIEAVRPFRND